MLIYSTADDDYDGVQYDDFYGSSAGHLEAEEIRRECATADGFDVERESYGSWMGTR